MTQVSKTYVLSHGAGPSIEAEVLVSPTPFSARYDLDRKAGVISREGHPLQGMSIRGRILIAPGVQGGVAAAWALPAMADKGVCFAGLILSNINPVMVQGAVTAGIPVVAGFDAQLFEFIRTGDRVRLDTTERVLTILRSERNIYP